MVCIGLVRDGEVRRSWASSPRTRGCLEKSDLKELLEGLGGEND